MSNITSNINDTAKECSKNYDLPFEQLSKCADSPLGNSLLFASGMRTNTLVPSLNYVPWITLNNIHTGQIQTEAEGNLTKFICDQYKVGLDLRKKNPFKIESFYSFF